MDGDPEVHRLPKTSQNYSYREMVGNQNKAPFSAALFRRKKNTQERMCNPIVYTVCKKVSRGRDSQMGRAPFNTERCIITEETNTTIIISARLRGKENISLRLQIYKNI